MYALSKSASSTPIEVSEISEGLDMARHVPRDMSDRARIAFTDRLGHASELASPRVHQEVLAYGAQKRRETQVKHVYLGRGEHRRPMVKAEHESFIPAGTHRLTRGNTCGFADPRIRITCHHRSPRIQV